jgi:hypothetical protein
VRASLPKARIESAAMCVLPLPEEALGAAEQPVVVLCQPGPSRPRLGSRQRCSDMRPFS